jgi:hypothetical protein
MAALSQYCRKGKCREALKSGGLKGKRGGIISVFISIFVPDNKNQWIQ